MVKKKSQWWYWLGIVAYAIGLIWRFVYIFIDHPLSKYIYADMQNYASEALRFFDSHAVQGPQDTVYPPGMGYIFGFFYRVFHSWVSAEVLMFLFSALIPVLVYLIGRKLFSRRVAVVGLILASLYPGFVIFSGFLLSEIPATFCLLLSFWLLAIGLKSSHKNQRLVMGIGSGAVFAVATAIRSDVLLSGLLVGALLAVYSFKDRRIFQLLLASVITATLFIIPLSIRCSILDRQFCLASSNGSLGVLQGHYGNVGHFGFEDPAKHSYYEFGNPTTLQEGNEGYKKFNFGPYDERAAEHASWAWIHAHPGSALVKSLVHVRDLVWGSVPWPPANTTDRAAIIASEWLYKFFILLPAIIYCVILCLRRFRRQIKDLKFDLLLIAPILGIILTVFITVAEPRYRIPFDGFMILLAARAYEILIIRTRKLE